MITIKPAHDLQINQVSQNEFEELMKDTKNPVVLGMHTDDVLFVLGAIPYLNENGVPTIALGKFDSVENLKAFLELNPCQTYTWHRDHITNLDSHFSMEWFGADSIESMMRDRFCETSGDFKPSFLKATKTANNLGLPYRGKEEGESLDQKFERMVVYSLFLVLEEAEFKIGKRKITVNLKGLFGERSFYWRFSSQGKVRVVA